MCDIDKRMLERLKLLTNSHVRGDKTDDGHHAGSDFMERIENHVHGFERFSEDTFAVLAYDWTDLVGWALLTCYSVDHSGVLFNVPTCAIGLYVKAEARGKGIGKRLVREASDAARKNGMGRMVANPWNNASTLFFQSVGFVDITSWVPRFRRGVAVLDL